ncbi:hypothetical protein M3650_10025 [Paenibacillus sp. MER TA 81-3]|uniref:hypothetical protein n=1 Tax=Paenibacillus sp. MER TA 81-3 TaxID=2939573 RepID=UPI0020421175|nr:hypothetical protein [Paenibacillus sp. MER TA 81-3]MCM3338959.1 hypothetical protein [Paenibacillus sp. MER TA 81-3]
MFEDKAHGMAFVLHAVKARYTGSKTESSLGVPPPDEREEWSKGADNMNHRQSERVTAA